MWIPASLHEKCAIYDGSAKIIDLEEASDEVMDRKRQ
jgi:hypothetical protein